MAKTIQQIQDMITAKYDIREVINAIADYLQDNPGGGGVTIGGTYDTNAAAVAALGAGKLYKSSTLVNGSPIILITV
jgi:alanine dehydrogenase